MHQLSVRGSGRVEVVQIVAVDAGDPQLRHGHGRERVGTDQVRGVVTLHQCLQVADGAPVIVVLHGHVGQLGERVVPSVALRVGVVVDQLFESGARSGAVSSFEQQVRLVVEQVVAQIGVAQLRVQPADQRQRRLAPCSGVALGARVPNQVPQRAARQPRVGIPQNDRAETFDRLLVAPRLLAQQCRVERRPRRAARHRPLERERVEQTERLVGAPEGGQGLGFAVARLVRVHPAVGFGGGTRVALRRLVEPAGVQRALGGGHGAQVIGVGLGERDHPHAPGTAEEHPRPEQ